MDNVVWKRFEHAQEVRVFLEGTYEMVRTGKHDDWSG